MSKIPSQNQTQGLQGEESKEIVVEQKDQNQEEYDLLDIDSKDNFKLGEGEEEKQDKKMIKKNSFDNTFDVPSEQDGDQMQGPQFISQFNFNTKVHQAIGSEPEPPKSLDNSGVQGTAKLLKQTSNAASINQDKIKQKKEIELETEDEDIIKLKYADLEGTLDYYVNNKKRGTVYELKFNTTSNYLKGSDEDFEEMFYTELVEDEQEENIKRLQIIVELSQIIYEEENDVEFSDVQYDDDDDDEEQEGYYDEEEDEDDDEDDYDDYEEEDEQEGDEVEDGGDEQDDDKPEGEEGQEDDDDDDEEEESQVDDDSDGAHNQEFDVYLQDDQDYDFTNLDEQQRKMEEEREKQEAEKRKKKEEERRKKQEQDKKDGKQEDIKKQKDQKDAERKLSTSQNLIEQQQNVEKKEGDIEMQDINIEKKEKSWGDDEEQQGLDSDDDNEGGQLLDGRRSVKAKQQHDILEGLVANQIKGIQNTNLQKAQEEQSAIVVKKQKKKWFAKKQEVDSDDDEKAPLNKKEQKNLERKQTGEQKFDRLCKLRAIFRTFLHFGLIIVAILFFVLYQAFTYDEGTKKETIKVGTNFNFSVKNCLINMEQHNGSDMEIQHYIHHSVQPFQGDDGDKTEFEVDVSSSNFKLRAESAFSDMKYCYLHIALPKKISTYGNFNFDCIDDSECVFVYQGETLSFGNINVKAPGENSVISMNIESIKYNNLNVQGDNRGLIYLQNIDLTDKDQTHTTNINLQFGEVIIQSQNDYYLDFYNPFQSICYAAPHIKQDGDIACDISQDGSSDTSLNYVDPIPVNNSNSEEGGESVGGDERLKGCTGKIALCSLDTCNMGTVPKFTVRIAQTGNIYANIIENVGYPPQFDTSTNKVNTSNQKLIKGLVYDEGLNFNDNALGIIEEFFEAGNEDLEPIWIIDIGNKYVQSSTSSLWVKSANPTFALMRPWWLATWSFSLLVTQTTELQGYLQPGFCPYSTSMTINQYWQIKQTIYTKLQKREAGLPVDDRSSITFVQHERNDLPEENYQQERGVVEFDINEKVSSEKWYELVQEKGMIVPKSYDQSRQALILVTLLLSIFVSLIITGIAFYVIIKLLPTFKAKLAEESGQFAKYTSTIAANNQELKALEQEDGDDEESGFIGIGIGGKSGKKKKTYQPSFVASYDFYSFLQTRKSAKSSSIFFSTLFKRADQDTEKKLMEGEIDSETFLEIKERTLKNLYEKFCFLNHYTEVKLTDETVIKELENVYGYKFVNDGQANQVFVKISEKRKVNIPDPTLLKVKDSIETFFSIFYDITGRETDDVWVEDVQQSYVDFCRDNRLKRIDFRAEQIAKKYKLDLVMKPQQKLIMKKSKNQGGSAQAADTKNQKPQGKYLILQDQLKLVVDLMSDPGSFTDKYLQALRFRKILLNEFWDVVSGIFRNRPYIHFTKEETAFMDCIYGNLWIWTDFLIVVKHFILNGILLAPIFAFLYINQTSYFPYSLNHPVNLLAENDLKYSLVYLPWYIGKSNPTFIICMSIIFVFMIIQSINEFLIFIMAKFPVDRAFEEEKKRGDGIQTKFQFVVMMILISCGVFYISMNMLWLLLGAIINPNFFLVYTTSVLTLITFVTAKKKAFDEIYNGGTDMIKQILLKEYTKKVQGIMGSLEAEKSSILSQAQDTYSGIRSGIVSTASAVGLGAEAEEMMGEVDGAFKSVEKMSAEDMNPSNIKAKAAELEQKMKDKALEQIKKELVEIGLQEELAQAIFALVIKNDKKECSRLVAKVVAKQSDGKLPEKLIIWILETIQNHKKMNSISMGKDLQNSILEIILEGAMGKIDPELRSQIRNLVALIMGMIDALQNNDLSGIINIFKELMFLIPLQAGQDWTYSPIPTFILKFLEILQKIFSGDTNSSEFATLIEQCLTMAQIPDEVGLFLTVIPTQKDAQKWKYKNIKIDSVGQLREYVDSNIIQKISYPLKIDAKKSQFLSYIFSGTIKLLRGEQDFQDEINFGKKLVKSQIKKAIKEEAEDSQKTKKAALKQVLQYGEDIVKFVPIAIKSQEDLEERIKQIASQTNFPASHIRGLILSSTEDIYIKILNKGSREDQIIEENQFLQDLCLSFGIDQEVILGFMDMYHDKEDFDGRNEENYMEQFLQFIFRTLRTKSEIQQNYIRTIFKILRARSMWQVDAAIDELVKKQSFADFLKNMNDNSVKFYFKIFKEILNFQTNGDISQFQQFISPSFGLLKQEKYRQFIIEKIFKDKDVKEFYQAQQKKERGNQGIDQTPLKKPDVKKEDKKDQNQAKAALPKKSIRADAMLPFEQYLEKKREEFLNTIKKMFTHNSGTGRVSLFQTLRTSTKSTSMIDFIINCFTHIGLSKNAEKMLKYVFKVCYLKVCPTGYDRNDRLRLITDCAKELKITTQALTQILSFFNISHQNSIDNITEFYLQNSQLLPKCKNPEMIVLSCKDVLEFVQQQDKINCSVFDFMFQEQKQKPNKKKKQKLTMFDTVRSFLTKEQVFKAVFSGQMTGVNKDTIINFIHNGFLFLEGQSLLTSDDRKQIEKLVYKFFYMSETLDITTISDFIDLDITKEKSPEKIKNIEKLITIFKLIMKEDTLGLLNELKYFVKKLFKDTTDQDLVIFIFDIIATIHKTDKNTLRYKPGKYAEQFYNFFPLIQYRYNSDTQAFAKFGLSICTSLFKFDSISQKELEALFSLFGKEPRIDEASELLSIDTYIIEVAYGLTSLIMNKNPLKTIQKFTSFTSFEKLCKQSKLSEQELTLLLKLTMKCFTLEDLEEFFDIFGMKKQLDIEVLKGFFGFMLPVSENIEGAVQQDLKNTFLRNYNSRKYLYTELVSKEKKVINSDVIPPHKQYDLIELYYNIVRGRFQNISYQLTENKIIKDMKLFGGQKFLRQSILGIIGYTQIQNSEPIKESYYDKFVNYRNGKTPVANDFDSALFFLDSSLFKEFFDFDGAEFLEAFTSDPLTEDEYLKQNEEIRKSKGKNDDKEDLEDDKALSNVQKYRRAFYNYQNNLSYADKFRMIESWFLQEKNEQIQDHILKLYQSDYEKQDKLYYQQIELFEDKIEVNKQFINIFSYNDYEVFEQHEEWQFMEKQDYIERHFYILLATIQDMKYRLKKQKEFYNSKDKKDLAEKYDEMAFYKYVLDLDLILTGISRMYLLDKDVKKQEFFRKNYILELLTLINQPLPFFLLHQKKGKIDYFRSVINQAFPSNPSCYIDKEDVSDKFNIFETMLYNKKPETEQQQEFTDMDNYEKFLEAYSEIYLNEDRFKIIQELEDCYKICKEDVEYEISELTKKKEQKKKKEEEDDDDDNNEIKDKKDQKQNEEKRPKKKAREQLAKFKESISKQYKDYQQKCLSERDVFYSLKEAEGSKITNDTKLRIENLRIIKKSIDEFKMVLLTNPSGIKDTIELVYKKSPGVLGSKQTKDLIINILKIQDQKHRHFTLIEKVISQLQNMHSNTQNLEIFLETLCNPDKDEKLLKNFIKTFIDQRFANQFNGILYTTLLKYDKLNLRKIATIESKIECEEEVENFETMKDEERIKLIKEKSAQKTDQMIDSAVKGFVSRLKISQEQQRMVLLLLKCYMGQNDSWLLLFTEKIPLFKKEMKQFYDIGTNFLYSFFSYQESLQKINKTNNIFDLRKAKKSMNLQELLNELSSKNEITKGFGLFENFFKNENNLPFKFIKPETKQLIRHLISMYTSDNNNDFFSVIGLIFNTKSGIIKNIPENLLKLLENLNGYEVRNVLYNPGKVQVDIPDLIEEINEITEFYRKKNNISQDQKDMFDIGMRFMSACASDDPLTSISVEIQSIFLKYKEKLQKKLGSRYHDLILLSSGCISAQIIAQSQYFSEQKAQFLIYFGMQVIQRFISKFYDDKENLDIVDKAIQQFEEEHFQEEYYIQNLISSLTYKNEDDKNPLISGFDKFMDKLNNELKAYGGAPENNKKANGFKEKYPEFKKLFELLKPVEDMVQQGFKVITGEDLELNALQEFFKILFYYFSGYCDTSKGSEAWKLVKQKKHTHAIKYLINMVSGEDLGDDDESSQQNIGLQVGLKLIGDSLIIGYDVLKNKDSVTIREFLMKYDFLLQQYFQLLYKIINVIIEDEVFMDIIEIILQFLYTIFEEREDDDDNQQDQAQEILGSVKELFIFVLKQAFNTQEKNLKTFDNDQEKFKKFNELTQEILKLKQNQEKLQTELQKNQKEYNGFKNDLNEEKANLQDLQKMSDKNKKKKQTAISESEGKINKLQQKKENSTREIKKIQEEMKVNKKSLREFEDEVFDLDTNMKNIKSNVLSIIEKIQLIQQTYKSDIQPLIEDFKVNGFDMKVFVNKFIPVVIQLVSSQFDSSAQVFIVNITNSLIALINGDFEHIHDEFFLVLKLNPNDVDQVRGILSMFSDNSKKPLEMLEQKKNSTLNFINKKANDPSFNQFNKIKEKMEEHGLQPKDMFKLADIDGTGDIDQREFKLFFKKIGIDLSQHRVQEIFASAQQGSNAQSSKEQSLGEDEFIKAYEYVQNKSMFLTLESMGISKEILFKILLAGIILLLLIFVFIFIGVSAFAIPGTFGAIVNSIFPMVGGGGVAKSGDDPAKKLNFEKIKKVVQDSIATIQGSGV